MRQGQEPSIIKNMVYSTLYQILLIITPLITTPYVSRVLGPDGIGIYSYTASIQTYFSMFAAMGVMSYGAREIARNRNDEETRSKLFWEIECMVCIFTALVLVIWLVVINFYVEYRIYLFVLTLNLIAVVFDISWFFSGLEQFKHIVIKNSVVKIITIILLFVLVNEKNDLLVYIGLMAGGALVGNLSMWTKLSQFLQRVPIHTLSIKRHFRESFIYFIPTIASSVYTILDKTLIGVITHDTYENGYYEQATKIINMAKSLVFVALNSVMGVRTSYLFSINRTDEVHIRIYKSMDYILLMGFGMCFGIIGISDKLVLWFFGEGYGAVKTLLKIFSPIILIISISNCLGSMYYSPIGKRALSSKFIICGSVVNLVFNLLLIPKLGSLGAAIGSIIAETVITVLYLQYCEDYVTVRMLVELSWKRIIAGLIMLAEIIAISSLAEPSIWLTSAQIVSGVAVYGLSLLIMRDQYLKEVIKTLTQRFKRKK